MEIREHNPPGFQFPPGFRFHPSDEELMVHYLQNKATSRPLPASVIAEVDLYKYNPWELPNKAFFGEEEWYFFSPRDRKYPNGQRPNRAAGTGYWKATGTDKPILSSLGSKLGVKKALVFYTGRPPKGVKTDWIMNEYRLVDTTIKPSRSKGSMRLDDWVLCRIRQKSTTPTRVCEIQDTNRAESVSYSPMIEEARPTPTYTNNNADMIRDCLNKDCRLLASILAGQTLPPIEAVSTLSCQGSNNGNSFTSVFEGGTSDRVNSPLIVSSLDTNYFNPPYNKKPNCGNRDLGLQFSKALPNNHKNYYGQCQEGIYINPSDPFQEVHESACIGKY